MMVEKEMRISLAKLLAQAVSESAKLKNKDGTLGW